MSGALEGIRVIDFGQYLAGPLAALLLADNGAEVIRVDPPGGPRWQHPANAVLQRGKRSLVLDLKRPEDLATARALIASADVVIENFRPGVMERLGVGTRAMTDANSRLIYCSIPGFAEDDPRAGLAGWEGVVSAAAGLYFPTMMALPKSADDPTFTAVPSASSYAAFIAGHSIVAALIARQRGSGGQQIEVPLFDAAFQVVGNAAQLVNGKPEPRHMGSMNRAVIKRHRCADGRYVDVSPPLRGWAWFAERFLPKELNERGVSSIFNGDPAAAAELAEVLREVFKTRTAAEWERIANEEAGTGMALCQSTEEWLHDEHARGSQGVITLTDPEYGDTLQAGYPISLSKTPMEAQGPRHALDADRQAVLAELQAQPARGTPANGNGVRRPLEGFRAIDVTQVLAGPTACRILAEYGAEIVKIYNPRPENPMGAMYNLYVNNGKRSIMLDLKSPGGRDLLWRLAENADVFQQNFARGVAERLGIGEDDVRQRLPTIVYSSINTHADGGFRSMWRGHEELGQAVTGMEVRFGGDSEPVRSGWAVCDYGTGHLSAFALMLALFHRLRTGEGQHVKASLSGSATFLQVPFMIDYAGHVCDEPRGLAARGEGPLCRMYQASDRWLFLAAQQPGVRERLAAIEELNDVAALPDEQLADELAARFATAPAATWVRKLTAAGLAAHAVMRAQEILDDPIALRRGLVVEREHPGVGRVTSIGKSTRMSATPIDPLFGAPPIGWHSRELVAEAGLGEQFTSLVAAGTVAEPAEEVTA